MREEFVCQCGQRYLFGDASMPAYLASGYARVNYICSCGGSNRITAYIDGQIRCDYLGILTPEQAMLKMAEPAQLPGPNNDLLPEDVRLLLGFPIRRTPISADDVLDMRQFIKTLSRDRAKMRRQLGIKKSSPKQDAGPNVTLY